MTKDEILNKISLEYNGMYFNQIYKMKTRALILDKALVEVLNQGQSLPINNVSDSLEGVCKMIIKTYEGDGMEAMDTRDHVMYRACKDALASCR